MPKTILIICLIISFQTFNLHSLVVRKFDESKKKYYLFDESKNKAITKPEFDMIYCYPDNVSSALLVKGDKYGIYYFAPKKSVIIPMGKDKIKYLYNGVYTVEKNGKLAIIESKKNINHYKNGKMIIKLDAPIFSSDFVYTDIKCYDSVYHFSKKQVMKYTPLILLKKENKWYNAVLQFNQVEIKTYEIKYEIIKPILIQNEVNYIVKHNGKYGVLENDGFYLHHKIEYDSIIPIVATSYNEDGRIISTGEDYVLKNGDDYILNFMYQKIKIDPNKIKLVNGITKYEFDKESKYFLDNPEYEIKTRLKVGEIKNKPFSPSNMYVIKHKGKYGLTDLKKILIEPIHESYKLLNCNFKNYEISHIKFSNNKGEYLYSLSELLAGTEQINIQTALKCDCHNGEFIIKKQDTKWYFYKDNRRNVKHIGYDSIIFNTISGPTAYTSNSIHQYIGDTFVSLSIPNGAKIIDYYIQLKGFTYQASSGLYGFKGVTKSINPYLPNISVFIDKKGVEFFELDINSRIFHFTLDNIYFSFFYAIGNCRECNGNGYTYTKEEYNKVVEKGKTTTHTQQTHHWRDNPTYTTTTTKEPDKTVKSSRSVKVTCSKCDGTKLQKFKISSLNGNVQIEEKL